jgi:hypothetical protein
MPLPNGGWPKPTFAPRTQYPLPVPVESWWIGPSHYPLEVMALTRGQAEVVFSKEESYVLWRVQSDPTTVLVDTLRVEIRWDTAGG